tara:strand:+ start:148 stop:651 length:504 start_codon:yes stop_codon:yes gene_type:complete
MAQLAADENLIIVATIHQPSTKVYGYFTKTMLLSCGRVAFYGKAGEATDYFAGLGFELPGNMSIAEFMLDLVNREFTDIAQVDEILDAWEAVDANKKIHISSGARRSSMLNAPVSDLAVHRFNPVYKQIVFLLQVNQRASEQNEKKAITKLTILIRRDTAGWCVETR